MSGTLLPPAAAEAAWHGYARTELFAYSEPVTIEAAIDEWDSDYQRGKRQWAYLWTEAGIYHANGWSIGALYRHEFSLDFDEETAELYYQTSNDQRLQAGRQYQIDLEAMRFSAKGLRTAWHFQPWANTKLSIGASVFETSNLQNGRLQGIGTAEAENEYSFQADTEYYYEEDLLIGREVARPEGQGWSLDVSMQWRLPEFFDVSLRITDAFGKIQWRDVPYTLAQANSEQRGINENGFVEVEPVLSGYEGYKARYTQELDPRYQLQATMPLPENYQGQAKLNCQYDHCLYGIGVQRKALSLLYWPQFKGAELRFGGPKYHVAIISDALKSSDMRVVSLSFGINLP